MATTGSVINTLGDDSRGLAVTQVLPYPWRATTPLTREFSSALDRAKRYALNYGPQNHHGSNFVEITIVGPNRRFMR
ncbi:MAG: hypothetical protein HY855_24750 [Burkholderiales bacterium]|nr:hypothetical protein [Burkholderiales bacterium]